MKEIRMQIKMTFLTIFTLILLIGCSDERLTAPSSSTIAISPDSVSITSCGLSAWHTKYFTITVVDSEGMPMNGIDITVTSIWASPDTSNLIRLYKGETFSTSPITVTTDDSGKYDLKTALNVGCSAWTANVEVRTGTVFGSAAIAVDVP